MVDVNTETALRAIWPDMIKRFEEARGSLPGFVHYTSAEAATSMISGPSVWLRNASCMNDYGEIEYGIEKILEFFGGDKGRSFWNAIDEVHPDLSKEIKKSYDDWRHDLSGQTYMICLSEHDFDPDQLGRLSMWRAYGGKKGVAIVIDPEPLLRESDAIGAYTFPVFYLRKHEIEQLFIRIADNVVSSRAYIGLADRGTVHGFAFWLLQTLSFSLKHPAFMEEKEWRIVYRPNQNKSDVLVKKNVVIGGLPQIIYELPLIDIPEKEFTGISPNELIKKILIGPTNYPLVIKQSLEDKLSDSGVEKPEQRIEITWIPLRQD